MILKIVEYTINGLRHSRLDGFLSLSLSCAYRCTSYSFIISNASSHELITYWRAAHNISPTQWFVEHNFKFWQRIYMIAYMLIRPLFHLPGFYQVINRVFLQSKLIVEFLRHLYSRKRQQKMTEYLIKAIIKLISYYLYDPKKNPFHKNVLSNNFWRYSNQQFTMQPNAEYFYFLT